MRLASYRDVRVPSFSIRILRDVLIGAGLDNLSAFRAAGLDPGVAEAPGSVVTGEQELAFQLKFVELTAGRTDLWMKAGQRSSMLAFGSFGLALATSPTLTHFVEASAAADLTYTFADFSPVLSSRGVVTGQRFVHREAPDELAAFYVYRDTVAELQSLAMVTMRDPAPVTAIHLPLHEVSPELVRMLPGSAVINLDSSIGVQLEWDEHLSTEPLPHGDAFQHETYLRQMNEHLQQFRLEQDWVRSVVDAMKMHVERGVAMSDVAATLNSSVRTLQRRLEQNGTTFRRLRDQARFELATDMLAETNASVSEISRRLGYEEAASFTVAFKRWSGRSPSRYRASPPPRR
ncbi:helix-turn-helix domain-containing protein [Pseudarthrobacter phenanthrenivorans]|uniref:AraC family transcriptional regulator n=1 Tax=Pseudarthrobacter phenanthrenivorans TaxID=361575 RepID=UPI00344DD9B9